MSRSLLAVESLLSTRLGLDVGSLSPGFVSRAVERRCRVLGLEGSAGYEGRLLGDLSEWAALVDEVVVPETWLFRDGAPFDELAAFVRSRLPADPSRRLRVLSLPCASGEEPWSIAAVLSAAGLSPREASVDAVDVSPRLIEAARCGVYGRGAFRSPDAAARLGVLCRPDGRREVATSLRPYVRFLVGNALDYEAEPPLPCYDAVFCRNLLIYLTPQARRRVVFLADRMLHPGGLLVLGHAEAFSTFFPSYVPVERPRAFAAHKPAGENGSQPRRGTSRRERRLPVRVPGPAPDREGLLLARARQPSAEGEPAAAGRLDAVAASRLRGLALRATERGS